MNKIYFISGVNGVGKTSIMFIEDRPSQIEPYFLMDKYRKIEEVN